MPFRTKCPKCDSKTCDCYHWCYTCHRIITTIPEDVGYTKLGTRYVMFGGYKMEVSEEELCEYWHECFPGWINTTVPCLLEDNKDSENWLDRQKEL